MKTTILGAAIAATLVAASGVALAQQTYGDVARVISSTPIYDRVSEPRRECRTEQVTAYEERRSVREAPREARESGGIGAGTVLGAIVGGVIGHQFGGSSAGRDHGTAAGAVIGGLVGNQADREAESGYRPAGRDVIVDRVPVTRDVQRCENVADTTERIVGYDVRYEYNGREFRTRMPFDPGNQLAVNVEVRPPAANLPIYGPRTPSYRGTY
jgi:uncharacterized protein YcfJ